MSSSKEASERCSQPECRRHWDLQSSKSDVSVTSTHPYLPPRTVLFFLTRVYELITRALWEMHYRNSCFFIMQNFLRKKKQNLKSRVMSSFLKGTQLVFTEVRAQYRSCDLCSATPRQTCCPLTLSLLCQGPTTWVTYIQKGNAGGS